MEDNTKTTKHLVVIGGGAAGFFCAVNAARLCPGLQVTILEKTNKLLAKVRVSGGGRCNVTHACFDIGEMSACYPRGKNFVKKSFHRFFTPDTIAWFEDRGVRLKGEADGRMFPVTDSSASIINCLLQEAARYAVQIKMNSEVRAFRRTGDLFEITTNQDASIQADFICLATGGYPKAAMFEWVCASGHTIEEPVPSLFTFNLPGNTITRLMGVSLPDISVRILGTRLEQRGALLITHWGLSGPAILKLSARGARELASAHWNFSIHIGWLPDFNEQELKERFLSLRNELANQKLAAKNPFGLPNRLWEFLLNRTELSPETRWAELPARVQNQLIGLLCHDSFHVKGKTTFREEFVTAGGIRLSEINPQTMMSRKLPNLFFAGEVMDVDGITGGYNFQHAWTSGFVAAGSIAKISCT
jgi:predicted Rossmann fold flavoprotein